MGMGRPVPLHHPTHVQLGEGTAVLTSMPTGPPAPDSWCGPASSFFLFAPTLLTRAKNHFAPNFSSQGWGVRRLLMPALRVFNPDAILCLLGVASRSGKGGWALGGPMAAPAELQTHL